MVVGGGDTAMEEALFLTKFASKVYIVDRRNELRASKIMQKRAVDNEKIEFIWNSVVDDLAGTQNSKLQSVTLRNVETGEQTEKNIDGLFIAIGHKPNTEIFADKIDLDDVGYIVTRDRSAKTSVEGVFACGDAQDSTYRQAVTAAGTGCMAAIDAERYLSTLGGVT